MSDLWGLHTAADVPQYGHRLPHVGPMEGADWENNDGVVDNEWADGGCAHLALAFKNRWPDLKIGAEIGHRHGQDQVYHAWVHDGRNAHDVYGTHKNDPEANALGDGEIDLDVDPQRLAELQGIRWSPDEPWADRRVLRASDAIEQHWLGSGSPHHTASTDGIRYSAADHPTDEWGNRAYPTDKYGNPDYGEDYDLKELMYGQCAAYAVAHQRENPHLRFGIDWEDIDHTHHEWGDFMADEGMDEDEHHDHVFRRPQHIFTHDDHWAYDASGARPLDKMKRWSDLTLNHTKEEVEGTGYLESGYEPDADYVRKNPPRPAPPRTASTDGIRYAHVVEADVAEDLWNVRLAAAVAEDLLNRLHTEFHGWYGTGSGGKIDGEDSSDDDFITRQIQKMIDAGADIKMPSVPKGITQHDENPLGSWPTIEQFMKDNYPAAHRPGFYMGMEQAQPLMDGKGVFGDPVPDENPYETGPHAVAKHGYDPKEIAAGMLLLHNRAHGHRSDLEDADLDRLTNIARIRSKQQRTYEQRQQRQPVTARLAMPAPMPEGITFHHHPTNHTIDTEPWAGSPESTIMVQKFSAPAVEARHNGQTVGYLEWNPALTAQTVNGMEYGDHPPEVSMIKVHPDYRRHGVGTALFDFARQHQGDLEHSDSRTGLGNQWVNYEQSRGARLAMAWDEWAPKVRRREPGESLGPVWDSILDRSAGAYIIDHPEQPFETDFDSSPAGHGFSAVSYQLHPTEPEIGIGMLHAHSAHRKDGVAEALMRRLHQDYPNHRINPGTMLPGGQAFHDRMLDKEPDARSVVTAGRNGDAPPLTFEPFNTMWSNGIMARHAEDGRPVGHLHWTPRGEIDSITVHPELQRRGVGSAMLSHARANPDRYPSTYPVFHSQHLTTAGRAWAANDGHHLPDEQVYKEDDDPKNWGFTAVDDYVPLSQGYSGQNEEEMSRYLEQEWTPPNRTASTAGDGWPVWWRGRQRPGVEWDDRWSPNHREHTPGPWTSL